MNRTAYITDGSKLELERKNSHNVSVNEQQLLRPTHTSNSSINLIEGSHHERNEKENVFLKANSRSSSANKKPVNFMN